MMQQQLLLLLLLWAWLAFWLENFEFENAVSTTLCYIIASLMSGVYVSKSENAENSLLLLLFRRN